MKTALTDPESVAFLTSHRQHPPSPAALDPRTVTR
jgi:hypothetical protein